MTLKVDKLSIVDYLGSNKKELDSIVLQYLPARNVNHEISSLYEMMRDYPSRGGKGLRGSLCLLWTELFGGKREDALICAASLELYQNWILIHDDIEDASDLRRGLPALHKKYGVELAINAGDALHGKMWALLLQNEKLLGAHTSMRILSEFAMMLDETTEGQQMELCWSKNGRWEITEADYLLMVTKKAAWYTCITPARLGTIIAEARKGKAGISGQLPILEKIVEFGTNLGISFQIIDDVLNLTAEESKYGKEILGDILEGKRTLMLIHLLAVSPESQRENIIQIMSKPRQEKSREDAEYVFKLMKSSGSIDYARRLAKRFSEKALSQFEDILGSAGIRRSEKYKLVRSLIEYLTSRDY
jgi:geranylgeranyl diphosphate synthase, type II